MPSVRPSSPNNEPGHRPRESAADGLATDEPTSVMFRVNRTVLAVKLALFVVFAVLPPLLATSALSIWVGAIVALALAVFTARDLIAPIRLAAGPGGVTLIAGYARREHLDWSQIERLRLDTTRRSQFLEIDTGETIHLFSRYDLSTSPRDALAALRKVRRMTG